LDTDKHLYTIFRHEPRWLFQLAGYPDPGECEFRSEQFKSVARTCDGIIVPMDESVPITLVEFQFRAAEDVYIRLVQEMTFAQLAYPGRLVEGLIFFGKGIRDPKTPPWVRVIKVYAFEDTMRQFGERFPEHPLTHLIFPIVEEREEELEREGRVHYHALVEQQTQGELSDELCRVFVELFSQRFFTKSEQEIDMILIKDLPPFEETQYYKDVTARLQKQGFTNACIELAKSFFGDLEAPTVDLIKRLNLDQVHQLLVAVPRMANLDELTAWLAIHAPEA